MRRSHLLVLAANLNSANRIVIMQEIRRQPDDEWFNYTTDAWLVCTATDPTAYLEKLRQQLDGTGAYLLVIQVDHATCVGGLLPEEAWQWLRRHNILRQ